MAKFMVIIATVSIIFVSSHLPDAEANTDPLVFHSDEWTLTIDHADQLENEDNNNDDVDFYSLQLDNESGEKDYVHVFTFSSNHDNTYDYGYAWHPTDDGGLDIKETSEIEYENLPVKKDTDAFDVVVMWQNEGKQFKQEWTVPVNDI